MPPDAPRCALCGGTPVVAWADERNVNPHLMPRQILICEPCTRKVPAFERITTEGVT